MANKKALRLLFVAAITSIGLNIAPVFAVTPGTWVGIAGFGTVDLEVNAQGTGIEKITYHFSSFTCGPVTMSGGIGITPGTAWPINNNGGFSFTNNLDPDKTMTIAGTFDSATEASGTWKAVFHGTQCAGTWDTSPEGGGGTESDVTIDHAFIEGVYWNPDDLPGWGFFVDVQEDTMFGAVYGYLGSDSTFITLQGTRISTDPLVYEGDVYFISNGGSSVLDVGNFTWSVGEFEASPAANLTITSNILNATNLGLVRFSYSESDKVDMLTGADWNIVRRVSGMTFGDHYAITDTRAVEDGTTFAMVVDNFDTDLIGAVGYMELDEGNFFTMLVEFDSDTFAFYVFMGSNTDMYGRYWLLDLDEEPTGDGSYFRGAVDSLQAVDDPGPGGGGFAESLGAAPRSVSSSDSAMNSVGISESRDLERMEYDSADEALEPMFSEATIRVAFEIMRRENQSINK